MAGDEFIGTVVGGRYRVTGFIGEGAMGVVYEGEDELTKERVAIKLLKEALAENEAMAARFRREARSAARIYHPNVMGLYEIGELPGGLMYMAMEFVDGRTLTDELDERQYLPASEALKIMIQVARGVGAAHRLNVIHRDLKPDNIVFQPTDWYPKVKVLDFGLAKSFESDSPEENITINNEVLGTPVYMSPEQCAGRKLTPASDVYALGIVFYEMLTGIVPFDSPNPVQVMIAHQTREPKPPTKVIPEANIPPRIEEVVLKCLSKKPEDRYPTAVELTDALLELHEELYPEEHDDFLDFLESLWEERSKTQSALHPYGRLTTALGRAAMFTTSAPFLTQLSEIRRVEQKLVHLGRTIEELNDRFRNTFDEPISFLPELKRAQAHISEDIAFLERILAKKGNLDPVVVQLLFPHLPKDALVDGATYMQDLYLQKGAIQKRISELVQSLPHEARPLLQEIDSFLLQRMQVLEELATVLRKAVDQVLKSSGSVGFEVIQERIREQAELLGMA